MRMFCYLSFFSFILENACFGISIFPRWTVPCCLNKSSVNNRVSVKRRIIRVVLFRSTRFCAAFINERFSKQTLLPNAHETDGFVFFTLPYCHRADSEHRGYKVNLSKPFCTSGANPLTPVPYKIHELVWMACLIRGFAFQSNERFLSGKRKYIMSLSRISASLSAVFICVLRINGPLSE